MEWLDRYHSGLTPTVFAIDGTVCKFTVRTTLATETVLVDIGDQF